MQALGLVWGDVDPFARDFEETCTLLREPVHLGARLLFNRWREKEDGGSMVVGRDLPSDALSPVLRNLVLYEPVDGGGDFKVRMAGGAFVRRFGRDITGLCLSDLLSGAAFEQHRDEMAGMLAARRHFSVDVVLRKARRNSLHFEVLGLPVLTERGARWALAGMFYHDRVG